LVLLKMCIFRNIYKIGKLYDLSELYIKYILFKNLFYCYIIKIIYLIYYLK
jgi:hypothetical protein